LRPAPRAPRRPGQPWAGRRVDPPRPTQPDRAGPARRASMGRPTGRRRVGPSRRARARECRQNRGARLQEAPVTRVHLHGPSGTGPPTRAGDDPGQAPSATDRAGTAPTPPRPQARVSVWCTSTAGFLVPGGDLGPAPVPSRAGSADGPTGRGARGGPAAGRRPGDGASCRAGPLRARVHLTGTRGAGSATSCAASAAEAGSGAGGGPAAGPAGRGPAGRGPGRAAGARGSAGGEAAGRHARRRAPVCVSLRTPGRRAGARRRQSLRDGDRR
jgi:hypothetical protein